MKKFILLVLTVFMLIPLSSCSGKKKIKVMDWYKENVLEPAKNEGVKGSELLNRLVDTPAYQDGDISIYIDQEKAPTVFDSDFCDNQVYANLVIYDGNNAVAGINMHEVAHFVRPDGTRVENGIETPEDSIILEIDMGGEEHIKSINEQYLFAKGYELVQETYTVEIPDQREYLQNIQTIDKDRLFFDLDVGEMIPYQHNGMSISSFDKVSVFKLKEGCSPVMLLDSIPLYNFVYFYDYSEYKDKKFEDEYTTINLYYDAQGFLHNQDDLYNGLTGNKHFAENVSGVSDFILSGFDGLDNYEEEILFQK